MESALSGDHTRPSHPQTARARMKRGQMLDAAQRLVLDQGYTATSTDAIAHEAGVSKQTLYAYFPSKEDLLVAVLERLVDPDGLEAATPFAQDHVPADAAALRSDLIVLAQEMTARIMQPAYLALLRTIIAEAPRQPRLAALFRATIPERGFRAIGGLLQRAAANGVIANHDHDAAARLFIGALLTYTMLDGLFVTDGPPRPPSPDRIETIVDLFLRAVT